MKYFRYVEEKYPYIKLYVWKEITPLTLILLM